jgi:hypothetical protein
MDRDGTGERRGHFEKAEKGRVVKNNLQVLVRHHDSVGHAADDGL